MNRLFGSAFGAVIIYLISIFLPNSIAANIYFQALVGVIVLALLGSGLLSLVFDIDNWPDRGYVAGTVWAGVGAAVMHLIFPSLANSARSDLISGSGLWAGIALEILNLAIGMLLVAVPVVVLLWLIASFRGKRSDG
jgi:hypothetical protein